MTGNTTVYVGIGSNLSNPMEQVQKAIAKIQNSDLFADV